MDIERIKLMEERFDRASDAVKRMSEALEVYESVKDDINTLNEYYGSEEWKQDLADDEAGLLPKDLKRGVLSEDGIWDLLSEHTDMLEQMKQMCQL